MFKVRIAANNDRENSALLSSKKSGGQFLRSDFSSFRTIMRDEREAPLAADEVGAERARSGHKAAIAAKVRMMTEEFGLKRQLIMKEKDQWSGVAGGKPWASRSRG